MIGLEPLETRTLLRPGVMAVDGGRGALLHPLLPDGGPGQVIPISVARRATATEHRDLEQLRLRRIASGDGPATPGDQPGQQYRASLASRARGRGRGIDPSQTATSALPVPGQPGQDVPATFTLVEREARYRNEVGLFPVDAADGRIGALRPGDRG